MNAVNAVDGWTPGLAKDRVRGARVAGEIEHVVIIVKENHTFDNYFGAFPGVEDVTLDPAANPPLGDPDHKHQTWMQRGSDTVHRVQ